MSRNLIKCGVMSANNCIPQQSRLTWFTLIETPETHLVWQLAQCNECQGNKKKTTER